MKYKVLIFPLFIRRVIEIIVVEIFLSALATALSYVGLYDSPQSVFLASLATAVVYFVWTVYCLISFRNSVRGKKVYFLVNVPICAALFAGAIISGMFESEPAYTFLFLPFKVFHFAAKIWSFPGAGHMSRPLSTALMSAAIAIPLILIPLIFSTKRKLKMRGINVEKEKKDHQNNEAFTRNSS